MNLIDINSSSFVLSSHKKKKRNIGDLDYHSILTVYEGALGIVIFMCPTMVLDYGALLTLRG